VKFPLLVIGGGLSGIAAATRAARFIPDVLILEKHSRIGGLNSYFYRNKTLFETGLHAITNYAEAGEKTAPLNRLLRQLKLKRKDFSFCQQYKSEVNFLNSESLCFSNDFRLLESQIHEKFPDCIDEFQNLLSFLDTLDPFSPSPFRSAKSILNEILGDRLLTEMLLCPLMYYGSSHENDMDLNQFTIMFQAIYQQGMFRPKNTIKEFLDYLINHYQGFGGRIRTNSGVAKIIHKNKKVSGVELSSGEVIECDHILSTIGYDETRKLFSKGPVVSLPRLSFIETIFQIKKRDNLKLASDKTIIFFNSSENFSYKKPKELVDYSSGVICFPANFHGIEKKSHFEIRATHLANYSKWKAISSNRNEYTAVKTASSHKTLACVQNIVGNFSSNIVYENTFTPVTVEKYTAKIDGAIYGSPVKIKDGDIGFSNLFLAGTDQGFLGIIGSMLSGVSVVNQHILPKL
jgi:phytoene dehydrogenase-like protein